MKNYKMIQGGDIVDILICIAEILQKYMMIIYKLKNLNIIMRSYW